jgi:hypothetical protein
LGQLVGKPLLCQALILLPKGKGTAGWQVASGDRLACFHASFALIEIWEDWHCFQRDSRVAAKYALWLNVVN